MSHSMIIRTGDGTESDKWYLSIANSDGVIKRWLFRPDGNDFLTSASSAGTPQSVQLFSQALHQSQKTNLSALNHAIVNTQVLIDPNNPPQASAEVDGKIAPAANAPHWPFYPPNDPVLTQIDIEVPAAMDESDRLMAMFDILLDLSEQPGMTMLDAIAEAGEDLLLWVATGALRAARVPLPRALNPYKKAHMQHLAAAFADSADYSITFNNYSGNTWDLVGYEAFQNPTMNYVHLPGKDLNGNSGFQVFSWYESFTIFASGGYTNAIRFEDSSNNAYNILIAFIVPQQGPGGLGYAPYWELSYQMYDRPSQYPSQTRPFPDPATPFKTTDSGAPYKFVFSPTAGHSTLSLTVDIQKQVPT